MEESIFQTFLLFAYSDIALLSVTIANYAVSASFVGREIRLSRWRMEKRKKKLSEELRKFQEKPQIEEIKKKIKEYDSEVKRITTRIWLLSWLGAVIFPSMFFIISFVSAMIGLNLKILVNDPSFLQHQLLILSIGTISLGFMILLFVIRTIDSAARKIPIPEFKISFRGGTERIKYKSKQKEKIFFCLENKGEDIAEDLEIFLLFPPSFNIDKDINYVIHKQGLESDNPDYNAAIFLEKFIHIDTTLDFEVIVTMPDKQGTYEIPINICERKTGTHEDKLIIEIFE